tara:strand:+ start:259 stop:420 length:162 start_codon:yes stop_codon:yes gene_type:complete
MNNEPGIIRDFIFILFYNAQANQPTQITLKRKKIIKQSASAMNYGSWIMKKGF